MAGEIVEFAREFDPQPFHTDEEAARGATGGLVASGWRTTALLLRMNCDAFLMRAAVIDEPGSRKSAGSVRQGRATSCMSDGARSPTGLATPAPAKSSFSMSLVGNSFRGVNQRGEEVLAFSSVVLVARRPGEA